jgi:hypothetical protein
MRGDEIQSEAILLWRLGPFASLMETQPIGSALRGQDGLGVEPGDVKLRPLPCVGSRLPAIGKTMAAVIADMAAYRCRHGAHACRNGTQSIVARRRRLSPMPAVMPKTAVRHAAEAC